MLSKQARAVSVLHSNAAGGTSQLLASNKPLQKQLAGPDFSERQAKVVSKYSYNLPQKQSVLSQISNSAHAKKHVATSLLQENQKNYIKSLRRDAGNTFDMEMPVAGAGNPHQQSPFISKVQEGLNLKTFGNDRGGFYNHMELET